jgi:hypothetical protein
VGYVDSGKLEGCGRAETKRRALTCRGHFQDVLWGVWKARKLRLLDLLTFDSEEYEVSWRCKRHRNSSPDSVSPALSTTSKSATEISTLSDPLSLSHHPWTTRSTPHAPRRNPLPTATHRQSKQRNCRRLFKRCWTTLSSMTSSSW